MWRIIMKLLALLNRDLRECMIEDQTAKAHANSTSGTEGNRKETADFESTFFGTPPLGRKLRQLPRVKSKPTVLYRINHLANKP